MAATLERTRVQTGEVSRCSVGTADSRRYSEQPSPSGPAVSRYFGDGHDFTHTAKLQPALPRGTT